MELFIFACFHAQAGLEGAVEASIREVAGPTRKEPGCLDYSGCRAETDPRLFLIYSRWIDEAAFIAHAGLPHTVRFIERVQRLIDHPLDVTHARKFAPAPS
ncbi:MAG TPA: antibiotic biosynthesis monooxygenase family protein [Steroidobacteraceae bacterium]|nr:antibiotic biosynthesis monooxygenase family protein [Steroidobacteraceae bacterium]